MKKLLCLAMGAIFLLALFPAAFAGVNDYVGKWTNADLNTRGITTLHITVEGQRITVHAWGKCHPQDCDWGTAKAQYYRDNTLRAVYTTKIAKRSLVLTMEGANTMKAQVLTHFTDKSGREDYRSSESFTRAAGGTVTSTTGTRPAVVAPVAGSRTVKQPKGEIKIISPNGDEVWTQGNRYGIEYETTWKPYLNNFKDASISLKNTATNQEYTIVPRWKAGKQPIPNRSNRYYNPAVPCNVTKNIPPGKYKVRIALLDGSDWDESNGEFTIHGPVDVDLVCDIRHAKLSYTAFDNKRCELEFQVWVKNKGTKRLKHVMIDYRVLKLPQKLLIYQQSEGIGFSDMHPDTWYNAPQKIDILMELAQRRIGSKGKYVLEVVVDSQNRQRENEEYRSDNTAEFLFEIK